MNTKNIISGVLLAGMFASITPALAQTEMQKSEMGQTFCQRINTVESNWTEHMDKKSGPIGGMMQKMKNMFGMRDKQRGEMMEMSSKNSEEKNTALRAKATTDAEKAAVETYITVMTTAEKTRTTTMDTAIAAYRSGVDMLLTGKSDAGSVAYAAFKTSVESAIATARTACLGTTPDDKVISTAFKTSVKSAQEALKAKKADTEALKIELKKLADARKSAVDAAQDAFKISAETAKTELQKIMKIDGMMKDMKKQDKKEMKEKREENKGEQKEKKGEMKQEHKEMREGMKGEKKEMREGSKDMKKGSPEMGQ